MATFTTQPITRAGVTPTYAAAAGGGDACECGDDVFVQIKNGSGGAITVTFAIPAGNSGYSGAAYANNTVSVPATTGDKMFGPVAAGLYKDTTTGLCTITYSGVTSLTVGVFKLQAP